MLRKLRKRYSVNWEALKEDSRKIGVSMIISGVIGMLVLSDKISIFEGVLIAWLGITIWLIGILEKK